MGKEKMVKRTETVQTGIYKVLQRSTSEAWSERLLLRLYQRHTSGSVRALCWADRQPLSFAPGAAADGSRRLFKLEEALTRSRPLFIASSQPWKGSQIKSGKGTLSLHTNKLNSHAL